MAACLNASGLLFLWASCVFILPGLLLGSVFIEAEVKAKEDAKGKKYPKDTIPVRPFPLL